MNEPESGTAWVDRAGYTWVRIDDPRERAGGPWWWVVDVPGYPECENEPLEWIRMRNAQWRWTWLPEECGEMRPAEPWALRVAVERVRFELGNSGIDRGVRA